MVKPSTASRFPVYIDNADPEDGTVAEIVAVSTWLRAALGQARRFGTATRGNRFSARACIGA
jgi:hypothetical protein